MALLEIDLFDVPRLSPFDPNLIAVFFTQKLNRKLHLSRTKTSKFNESGQLLTFYLISAAWGIEIFRRENFLHTFQSTWKEYPHAELTYLTKFFFIIQISYWIHNFPELYFQKIKKEEWRRRITYSLIYLVAFSAAYLLK